MKTQDAARKCGVSVGQFRRLAKTHRVDSVKRNSWQEADVVQLAEMLTKTKLKDRGWTNSLIDRFATHPDKTFPNPRYKSAAPMKLYRLVRIKSIEATEEWQQAYAKVRTRKSAAHTAARKKRQQTIEWAQSIPIEVQVVTVENLLEKAIAHYNARHFEKCAIESHSQRFLNRITVNFLRHACTNYEQMLTEKFGKVGTDRAYVIIKERVLREIGYLYPHLKKECSRQICAINEDLGCW